MFKTCRSIIRNAHFDSRTFAVTFLVIMLTQIIPLEGPDISYYKVGFMVVAIMFAISNFRYSAKALFYGALYYFVVFVCVSFASLHLRYSTIIYNGLFVFSFCGFYGLIHKDILSLKEATNTIRNIIFAFAIVLIWQQICTTVGFRQQEFTNICWDFENLYKLNSLSLEPSHAGRVLGCLSLSYLKLDGLQHSYSSIKDFYRSNKKVCWSILYTFITMGSTTSLMMLILVMMYFVQKKYIVYVVILFSTLVVVLPMIEYEPVQRAIVAIDATATGDQENVQDVDRSASVRTYTYFNTIDNINLSDAEYWFGHGEENVVKVSNEEDWMAVSNQIGGIYKYGFLAYLLSLLFVYKLCFRFFSLENLMFFLFLGFGIENIAYRWGCLMIFMFARFYEDWYKLKNK